MQAVDSGKRAGHFVPLDVKDDCCCFASWSCDSEAPVPCRTPVTPKKLHFVNSLVPLMWSEATGLVLGHCFGSVCSHLQRFCSLSNLRIVWLGNLWKASMGGVSDGGTEGSRVVGASPWCGSAGCTWCLCCALVLPLHTRKHGKFMQ